YGGGVGCAIVGCPPALNLTEEGSRQKVFFLLRPGQSRITTPRKETGTCKFLSGVAQGNEWTLGTPIAVLVPNTDQPYLAAISCRCYLRIQVAVQVKSKRFLANSLGRRSSTRERVAAGTIANSLCFYISLVFVIPGGEQHPDQVMAEKTIAAIDAVRVRGDSVGGVVTCIARNVPRGLGAPVLDKLEA
ncbi:hypothetical protein SELMODRAFT_36922, partial [Selaginella moellendorffii]